jgi:methionyl-tRNA formyltransferase
MRLIIFTNRDLASNLFLNYLLPHVSASVVQIFLSDKVGKKTTSPPPKALQELKFLEQTLPNEVVFPLLDGQNRIGTEGGKLLTFNELSVKYNTPIEALNDVRSAESLARIASLTPDLVLSVRYGKIFGSAFLKIPKLGTINLHSGQLPQYRGVLPTFRALMNGDETLFPTLHYIEDGTIDTGGVIGIVAMKVEKERSLLWHILHLYPQSVALVVATIRQIAEGKNPLAEVQETEGAAYFTFPTEEEIAVFLEKWDKLVDYEEYMAFLRRYTEGSIT